MALHAFSSMILPGRRAVLIVLSAAFLVLNGCAGESYPPLSSVPEPPEGVSSPEETAGIVASLSELKEAIEEDAANRSDAASGD